MYKNLTFHGILTFGDLWRPRDQLFWEFHERHFVLWNFSFYCNDPKKIENQRSIPFFLQLLFLHFFWKIFPGSLNDLTIFGTVVLSHVLAIIESRTGRAQSISSKTTANFTRAAKFTNWFLRLVIFGTEKTRQIFITFKLSADKRILSIWITYYYYKIIIIKKINEISMKNSNYQTELQVRLKTTSICILVIFSLEILMTTFKEPNYDNWAKFQIEWKKEIKHI